jgi:membrane associated rhomboid family serine protease
MAPITPTVRLLIIINVIMYVLTYILGAQGLDVQGFLSLHGFQSGEFMPHQLVTYLFLHSQSDLFHLIFNMFGLYMFGSLVEMSIGAKKFTILYFLAGIGGGVLYCLFNLYEVSMVDEHAVAFLNTPTLESYKNFLGETLNPGFANINYEEGLLQTEQAETIVKLVKEKVAKTPCVGASGSVFGLMAAVGVLMPSIEFRLLLFPIGLEARYFVPLMMVAEFFFGISGTTNVAHFGHLGGAITAAVIVFFWYGRRGR